jgi:hypothetical protein
MSQAFWNELQAVKSRLDAIEQRLGTTADVRQLEQELASLRALVVQLNDNLKMVSPYPNGQMKQGKR